MLVLIDNYDSFTYNLVQYFGDLGTETHVIRNDVCAAEKVFDLKPEAIVISPGPSDPDHAGMCLDLIPLCAEKNMPLLGVCLGHQAIAQSYGAKIIRTLPMHGKTSQITHNGQGVFKDIPSPYTVTRYHSLVADPASITDHIEITAQTQDNIIMGLKIKDKPIFGVQFHPESIATDHGHELLKNFLALTRELVDA